MGKKRQTSVIEKTVNKITQESSYAKSNSKEIIVSSLGSSEQFDSFFREFLSLMKRRRYKFLVVPLSLYKGDYLLIQKYSNYPEPKLFDSVKEIESGRLSSRLSNDLKNQYDFIFYLFFENIFEKSPNIITDEFLLMTFISKKKITSEDLLKIGDTIKSRNKNNDIFIFAKK